MGAERVGAGEGAAVRGSDHDLRIRRLQCIDPWADSTDGTCPRRNGELAARAAVLLQKPPSSDSAESVEEVGRFHHPSSIRRRRWHEGPEPRELCRDGDDVAMWSGSSPYGCMLESQMQVEISETSMQV